MKLSPILGLPIAEADDFTTDFPVEVDEPRTLGLESALDAQAADQTVAQIHCTYGSQSLPGGESHCAQSITLMQTGNPALLNNENGNGWIGVGRTGVYSISAMVQIDSLLRCNAIIKLYDTSFAVTGPWNSGTTGLGAASAMSVNLHVTAGHSISLWIWADGACTLYGGSYLSIAWLGNYGA